MSSVQSPSTGDIRILFWVGIAACLGGLVLFTGRAEFAALFMGGRFLLGIPFDGSDAFKMLFVEFGGVLMIAMGALILAVGLFLQARRRDGADHRAQAASTNP